MAEPDAKKITPVPKPTLSDDERLLVADPLRLVKGLAVERTPMEQAVDVTLSYLVLHSPQVRASESYVLSLPAAAKLARQIQEAVDRCLYRAEEI